MARVRYYPDGLKLKKDGTPRKIQNDFVLVNTAFSNCASRSCFQPWTKSQTGYVQGRGYTYTLKEPLWVCSTRDYGGCPTGTREDVIL